jgi:hypothetical protein
LCDVHLAVEKGTFTELARASHAATQFQHTGQQQFQDHRTAMPLQLQHVLPGERCGCREIQCQALIQDFAARVGKLRQGRLARLRQFAEQLLCHTRRAGT